MIMSYSLKADLLLESWQAFTLFLVKLSPMRRLTHRTYSSYLGSQQGIFGFICSLFYDLVDKEQVLTFHTLCVKACARSWLALYA